MTNNKKVVKINEVDELKQRQEVAKSVLANIVQIGGKFFAKIPLSLMKVNHTAYQREEKKHVIVMAKNWDDSKCTALLVNYREDTGYFWIIDGQHRWAAAMMQGIEFLVCEVFINMTVEEEAKRFEEYNTGTKSLSPFDTFKARICYGEETDTAILEICKKYHLTVMNGRGAHTLKSVTAARNIMKLGGKMALEWVLQIVVDSNWDDFSESYSADFMEGLARIYATQINTIDSVTKNLVKFFRNSNPVEVIGLANSEYPMKGRRTRLRLILEDIAQDNPNNKRLEKINTAA